MSILNLANKRSFVPVLGFIALGLFALNFYIFLSHLFAPEAEGRTQEIIIRSPQMHIISGVGQASPSTITIHRPFNETRIIELKGHLIGDNERRLHIELPIMIQRHAQHQLEFQEQFQSEFQLQRQAELESHFKALQEHQQHHQAEFESRLRELQEHRRHRR